MKKRARRAGSPLAGKPPKRGEEAQKTGQARGKTPPVQCEKIENAWAAIRWVRKGFSPHAVSTLAHRPERKTGTDETSGGKELPTDEFRREVL
jgi:hypothetical protein